MAAPVFEEKGANFGSTTSSVNVNYTSTVNSGDILIVCLGILTSSNEQYASNDGGFTMFASEKGVAGADENWGYLLWKRATGSESGTFSISFTGNANPALGFMLRFSGGKSSGDPYSGVVTDNGQSTPCEVPSVTNVTDGLMVGMNCAEAAWLGIGGWDSGWTERGDYGSTAGVSAGIAMATNPNASGGSVNTPTSDNWVGIGFVLEPDSSVFVPTMMVIG